MAAANRQRTQQYLRKRARFHLVVAVAADCLYDAEAVTTQRERGGKGMSSIRWRLVIGLLSLAASLALTAPAAASRLAGSPVGEVWPNATVPVPDRIGADIWPNPPPVTEGGPNEIGIGDSRGG